MKILVVCQNYYPEPFRISDICEELVNRGNEVSVITGVPNYPLGEIYEGYKKGERHDEVVKGVKIHRTFTVGRKGGVLKRFLNYYSFAISSKKYAKRLKEEFDVVFVNQLSPVMMANAGIAYAKKHKVPVVMYVMDLWPASLAAGGIGKSSLIYKYYNKVSKKIYKSANKLLVTSSRFTEYLEKQFRSYMEKSQIFLFTSDFNEGWGAVLNESMNSACAVVASHAIGSVPFLINDGENGFIYKNGDVNDLFNKVKILLDHPEKRKKMSINAYETMAKTWNAENAVEKFMSFVKHYDKFEEYRVINGPMGLNG